MKTIGAVEKRRRLTLMLFLVATHVGKEYRFSEPATRDEGFASEEKIQQGVF